MKVKTKIRNLLFLSLTMISIFMIFTASANAALTTIGTATYGEEEYNLIWDDDNNGNSVVWLDYTNEKADWSIQAAWAAGLDEELTINLYAGYAVTWDDDTWRLPTTVDDGQARVKGYEGDPDGDGIYTYTAGYNLANSELGHLFYVELSNLGKYDTSEVKREVYGLLNTDDFENLVADYYFSGTAFTYQDGRFWVFDMDAGYQWTRSDGIDCYAMALRSGQVSAVPIPGAVLLLGSGFLGLMGVRRKRKNIRITYN